MGCGEEKKVMAGSTTQMTEIFHVFSDLLLVEATINVSINM